MLHYIRIHWKKNCSLFPATLRPLFFDLINFGLPAYLQHFSIYNGDITIKVQLYFNTCISDFPCTNFLVVISPNSSDSCYLFSSLSSDVLPSSFYCMSLNILYFYNESAQLFLNKQFPIKYISPHANRICFLIFVAFFRKHFISILTTSHLFYLQTIFMLNFPCVVF